MPQVDEGQKYLIRKNYSPSGEEWVDELNRVLRRHGLEVVSHENEGPVDYYELVNHGDTA